MSPFSHWVTADGETPAALASALLVTPARSRAAFMRSPKVSIFKQATSPQVKHVEILCSVCLKYGLMEANALNAEASRVIDALGGTGEVAKLCEVTDAAVSQWRKDGIPRARLQFLRLARPEVFGHEARVG